MLAEANGRFAHSLVGGKLGKSGRLRSTAGGFRVSDSDLTRILRHVRQADGQVELESKLDLGLARGRGKVEDDPECHLQDPPSLDVGPLTLSRRGLLKGAVASIGTRFLGRSVTFLAAGISVPALADTSYNPPADDYQGLIEADGTVQVDASEPTETIWGYIGDKVDGEVKGITVELGSMLTDSEKVFNPIGKGLTPAAQLAGGLYGAAQLYSAGQTDAAYDAAKSTMIDTIPSVTEELAKEAAPEIVPTIVAVGVGTAAVAELPAVVIVGAAIVIVVGTRTVLGMAGEKFGELIVRQFK